MARQPFDPSRVHVPPEERLSSARDATLTVTQLTQMVKRAIEQHLPPTVHVVGEISNFKRHTSGHLYFVMKDAHCEISCVMWKGVAGHLKFEPTDGLEVFAIGHVDVFERSGRYQLYVRRMEPKGVGALELAFRQLREKLEIEGLFKPEHKRPLPRFPDRIAVVTSPTGAAVRDILQTLERRFPGVHVLLYPVAVQGPSAAGEIAAAIRGLNDRSASLGGIDCMIVGRGGGSLEDLWAFNEEIVARAMFDSVIPIVSAVGHEMDVSISDLVADVRAATPTAAAELAVPHRDELLDQLAVTERHLARLVAHRIALGRTTLDGLANRAHLRDPMTLIRHREQAVDECVNRLERTVTAMMHRHDRRLRAFEVALERIRPDVFAAHAERRLAESANRLRWTALRSVMALDHRFAEMKERFASVTPKHRFHRCKDRVESMAERLDAMSYKRTLGRGYTITRVKKGREVVRSIDAIADGDAVLTETKDGEFESRVINVKQMELFD